MRRHSSTSSGLALEGNLARAALDRIAAASSPAEAAPLNCSHGWIFAGSRVVELGREHRTGGDGIHHRA
jgi:hypothetical protein